MEFPDLGKHCNESTCRQLDFLPVKCDACKKVFCSEHYKYESHNCPEAYRKNVQVPVCPLCNKPVPGRPDELPDIRVSRHIDSDCQSDRAVTHRSKVYSNRCSAKGCKQKEMIPLVCDDCGQNYCLKHRHPPDHECSAAAGSRSKPLTPAARAALTRSSNSNPPAQKSRSLFNGFFSNTSNPSNPVRESGSYNHVNIQGNMSENEALQIALQASMSSDNIARSGSATAAALTQEQADLELAKAIAESEREAMRAQNRPRQLSGGANKSCGIS